MGAEETQQVVCMLFLNGENLLDERTSRWIGVAQPSSNFCVDLDSNSLGDQVLAKEFHKRFPVLEVGMGTLGEGGRIEVRLSLQLDDACGDPIGVLLFFFGVFEELPGNRLAQDWLSPSRTTKTGHGAFFIT